MHVRLQLFRIHRPAGYHQRSGRVGRTLRDLQHILLSAIARFVLVPVAPRIRLYPAYPWGDRHLLHLSVPLSDALAPFFVLCAFDRHRRAAARAEGVLARRPALAALVALIDIGGGRGARPVLAAQLTSARISE